MAPTDGSFAAAATWTDCELRVVVAIDDNDEVTVTVITVFPP